MSQHNIIESELPPGTLRVWWIRNVPNEPFNYYVNDLAEARHALNILADLDLRWNDNGRLIRPLIISPEWGAFELNLVYQSLKDSNGPVFSNAGGVTSLQMDEDTNKMAFIDYYHPTREVTFDEFWEAIGTRYCSAPNAMPLARLRELLALYESVSCVRCGSLIKGQHCSDEICPFSEHLQTCPAGWSGHTGHKGPTQCNCRTAP